MKRVFLVPRREDPDGKENVMKKVWIWRGVLLIGMVIGLSSIYLLPEGNLFWVALAAGVVLVTSPLWLPESWDALKRHIWWWLFLPSIVLIIATVTLLVTGKLWAFIALVILGVATMMALVLWLPYEMAKILKEEKLDGNDHAH